jgi:flagellar operon protein
VSDPLKIQPGGVQRPVPGSQAPRPAPPTRPGGGPSFADTLQYAQSVRFSNHAQKRLDNRQISLNDDGLARLSAAVDKAGQRGGKESLILMDDLAFIVNVRDRLVVTALDGSSRKEGVFTQIDSVVFANRPEETGTEKT